ncbi:MAG: fumarate hydratase [Candidatus Schekmanbacteria bacterium RIFCSPHIGHO2_02_FULL_38_11]|uniref:Fumarate hydratase n=1 Tax=Candidatus Schekmanbacteria bacterium RIFCSPLOWO2_12_FULL_38_15 TaxID=1817883 RepID=A0A1F7SKW7_9BACT|nr:MAG: fumarate hydratase [Candidatus Schekmanbacteria bacterium GWA2_38_9]OGL48191.1 MAG: fumarate hydratase [Candidatus Schekmanbacteria bacterium RIFCSPLOWO2_02_FULL_38_14]OGL54420.1 MAG: fumarate hydratase [Candidatus Schekmanbacteria bacterium RIFCSPLOWO2_12_FULL_38_15]OGL54637.1 MAG: fumarate hydratase [Candidatus Schekmanbacteria bacterium RIFCSPHIGHO2_02_FULL_38_11]
MKNINANDITKAVKLMCMEANYYLGEDVLRAFNKALKEEKSPAGVSVMEQLIENANIAKNEQVPMCQDTGFAVFFVELGQDAHITGGTLKDAINEGVRQGYTEGFLRKSIVSDPLKRVNTKDNTPAVVHIELVPGENLKITIAPKGGGSENMSGLKMLKPADGVKGVKDFVIERVSQAGSNPCPPIVVGVGIGGTFEVAAMLAKKALLRELGKHHPDPDTAELEKELLEKVNNLGIGPQGFGGRITALAVNIEKHPCHIASLPVAVNINCHAHRHKEVIL